MARLTATNFTAPLQFPYATAGTDLFLKEDVQVLAQAVDQHTHAAGKGAKVVGSGLATPLTLTMANSGATNGQGILNLVDTAGDACLVLTAGAGPTPTKTIRVENGALQVVNSGNTAPILTLSDTGALSVDGAFTAPAATINGALVVNNANGTFNSGQIQVRGPDNVSGSIILGDCLIQRWNANQIRFNGSAGTTQAGPHVVEAGGMDITGNSTFRGNVSIAASGTLTFAVNGYGWNGVSGQAVVQTAASVIAAGGSYYFDNGMAVRIYFDGTNIHTPPGYPFVAESNIKCRSSDGNFMSGTADQTIFGIWNPGQLRVKSSTNPDLLAAGQITAEGGPVTGKGAYINSASSAELKTNVVELDPAESLAKVLNPSMRPVQWEYAASILYPARAPRAGALEPDPTYEATPAFTSERLGFIAEEVNAVIPEACFMNDDGTAFGYQESTLLPLLWGAIRALEARLATLEAA
jgi:hypothetical protein